MAGPIASLLVKLGLDARDFQTGLKEQLATTGKFGAKTKAAFGIASLAVAGGFTLMTKGAAEMERAQGDFQAETGRSADEAKAFAKQMNGLVGTSHTVGRSFAEIANAGIAVAREFRLTGDAGAKMTDQFLAFSRVTKQDAAGAVKDFDEALDAWDEPAARATSLMDQLIASHQEYGTEAGPAALSALAKMAPALKGLGEGLDEGVGLLNLFEKAGIDASKAPMALNAALKQLKPGQDLDDLIAQIGAIEDPTLRAQAAMKLFGTRGGSGLANAIKPGMTSLKDYIPTIEDAAGATDKAADSMDTTTDRIREIMDKVSGFFRGLGGEFGPLLSGIAGIGTLLAPTLAKAFGGLGKNPLIAKAVGAAGAAIGTLFAAMEGIATKIASTIAAGFNAIPGSAAVVKAAQSAGFTSGGTFATGLIGGLAAGLAGLAIGEIILSQLRKPIEDVSHWIGQNLLGQGRNIQWIDPNSVQLDDAGKAAIKRYIETGSAYGKVIAFTEGPKVGAELTKGIADGVDAGTPGVEGAVTKLANLVIFTAGHGFNEVVLDATQMTKDLAGALQGGKNFVKNAMEDLMWAITHPMVLTRQLAEIEGALTGQNLADALASKNPEIAAVAQQTKAKLEARWTELTGSAYSYGAATGSSYLAGLIENLRSGKPSINSALDYIFAGMRSHSPPREGPLKDLSRWAVNIARAFVDPLRSTLRRADLSSALQASVPTLAGAAVGGGGLSIGSLTVQVQGSSGDAYTDGRMAGQGVADALTDLLRGGGSAVRQRYTPQGLD